MIGRLRGILVEKAPPRLMIEVSGVSYELDAPMFTFYKLPDIGQEIALHTHLVVREDAQLLYGFVHEQERLLFRHLIKVSNVGPKLALAILSGLEPDVFVRCVLNNDVASLVRIPGVGKKTAERLVIEMRDRLEDWSLNTLPTASQQISPTNNQIMQEAISALIALGYKPQEASRAISKIDIEQQNTSEKLIREALRTMVKGG